MSHNNNPGQILLHQFLPNNIFHIANKDALLISSFLCFHRHGFSLLCRNVAGDILRS